MNTNERRVYPALIVRSLFAACALIMLGHKLIRAVYRPGEGGPRFYFAEAARADFERWQRAEVELRAEADRARQAGSTTWPKDVPR